jgi:hypothetical protein
MERWQSTWENQVQYNLSESGVHPLKLGEILDGDIQGLLDESLGYSQTNGTRICESRSQPYILEQHLMTYW